MTRSEFEHIAAQLRQRVLKVGLDFFSNKEDAEDVAQETMVQLWRYLEHIDAERNVEALAGQAFGASVRPGRPIHVDGLEDEPMAPSYAAIAGALLYAHRNYEEKSILDGLLGRFFGK